MRHSTTTTDLRFLDLLGEQVEPCVFRPGVRLLEHILTWTEDDPLMEIVADSIRIINVEQSYEGLDDTHVGYDYVVVYETQEREEVVF